MGIPYYPFTTPKVASCKIGITLVEFNELVNKNIIEVDSLGSNRIFVNNDSVAKYIYENGGAQERCREALYLAVHEAQEKAIMRYVKLIHSYGYKKNDITADKIGSTLIPQDINIDGYSVETIIEYRDVMDLKKKNKKTLHELYGLGFTDAVLNRYYEEDTIICETIGNITYRFDITHGLHRLHRLASLYYGFFKSYKSNLRDYKQIKFLKFSEVKVIVKKIRKEFGL
ncbi:MAG TPA: hypothetical protein PLM93_09375 [Sulfuricurvum sp.]|nr:hypothetical protein [Sulfuricurvum sp.]HQT37424.1 hypothetical protein [Sulfuricurvum sp.]